MRAEDQPGPPPPPAPWRLQTAAVPRVPRQGHAGQAHSLDGFHPLLLLLWARGGDPVHHVVPLHHSAVRFCFAGLDDLPFVTGIVKLKAVLVERRGRLSWGCWAGLSAVRLLAGSATQVGGKTLAEGSHLQASVGPPPP